MEYGAEYLIQGQHFIAEEHPDGVYVMNPSDNVEHFKQYVDCVILGIKSGVVSYVAHPDLFNYVGDGEVYYREMKRICTASLENNIPLEINFLGIRTNRNYPNEKFWAIVGEVGSPVTFGFDSHDTLNAYDCESLKKAMALVKKYSLNYIGMPKIILLKDVVK